MKAIREHVIGIVGLGSVGSHLASYLGSRFTVYGFDTDEHRLRRFKGDGSDEAGSARSAGIFCSSDPDIFGNCDCILVCVPTLVDESREPDLSHLRTACATVGAHLQQGTTVVVESTVYPGVTEGVCRPIIEEYSGLRCGREWKIGYSPERINPGDSVHTLDSITKVTAGMDEESSELIAQIYSQVTHVHRAPSIRVAEAAKVIESVQRDVNIALMNEVSGILNALGLSTGEVLEAAATKWNFMHFTPGLVGGQCVGMDPHYLVCKAREVGYSPEMVPLARRINDSMVTHLVSLLGSRLKGVSKSLEGACVGILGATFKENVADVTNSQVAGIIAELQEQGAHVCLHDPHYKEYVGFGGFTKPLTPLSEFGGLDAVIVAVAHDEYRALSLETVKGWMQEPIIIDVKSLFGKDACITRL